MEWFWTLQVFDLKSAQTGRTRSLCRVEHLIIWASRLIGVGLNLFQVPDIISLIPGITRHLKPLSPGKADHTDYSPITFLLLSLYVHFSFFHSLFHKNTQYLHGQMCSAWSEDVLLGAKGEDKAVMEHVYFWTLNGPVPILLWSSSSWMMFTCLKPDYSISFWTLSIALLIFLCTPPCACSVGSLISPPLNSIHCVLVLCLHLLDQMGLRRYKLSKSRGCCFVLSLISDLFLLMLCLCDQLCGWQSLKLDDKLKAFLFPVFSHDS